MVVIGWTIICITSKHSDLFVYLLPLFRAIVSSYFIYSISTRDEQFDSCDYKAISPIIKDELYFCFGFLLDILFMSPSLKMTIFAHSPIYIVSQYFHSKLEIVQGDEPSLIIKANISVAFFLMIFAIYYLVKI